MIYTCKYDSFYPQYVIRASRDGIVEKVNFKQGDTVAKGTVLVKLQEEAEESS